MSDNVTLKPCPFCGGEGAFYRKSGSYGYYPSKTGVQCGNGDCLVQPKVSFDDEGYDWEKRKHIQLDSKAEAITAWNTRAQQSVPNSVVDAAAAIARGVNYKPNPRLGRAIGKKIASDILTNLQQSGQTEAELLREAREALAHAKDQFYRYAKLHRAKGTEDGDVKACTNAGYGEEMAEAIARIDTHLSQGEGA